MAAVWITLDYLDGRSLVRGPLYPDQVDLTGLLFRLNEKGIATARGGVWSATQVSRMLERLDPFEATA